MRKPASRRFTGTLISNRSRTGPRSPYLPSLVLPPHHTASGPTAKPETVPRDRKSEATGVRGVSCQICKCCLVSKPEPPNRFRKFPVKVEFSKTMNCHQIGEVDFLGNQGPAQSGCGDSGWVASDHSA